MTPLNQLPEVDLKDLDGKCPRCGSKNIFCFDSSPPKLYCESCNYWYRGKIWATDFKDQITWDNFCIMWRLIGNEILQTA